MSEGALPDDRLTRSPPTTEAFSEPTVAQSPLPPPTEVSPEHMVAQSLPVTEASTENRSAQSIATQFDQEIERLRHVEEHDGGNILPESLPLQTSTPSPKRFDLSPAHSPNLGSVSVPPLETSTGTQILQTPDLQASTGVYESDFELPRTIFGERLGLENAGLSDTPDFRNTAEAEVSY